MAKQFKHSKNQGNKLLNLMFVEQTTFAMGRWASYYSFNLLNNTKGFVQLQFLKQTIINIGGYQEENLMLVSQPCSALIYTGWPGTILVTRADNFQFQQDK
jgi:hypothetical protein